MLQQCAHIDRCGRYFDHRAQRQLLRQVDVVAFQILPRQLEQRAHRNQFIRLSHHRHQHAHRAVAGSAQDRADLGGEHRWITQRQPHAAHAKCGVVLTAQGQSGGIRLVGAQIQRADRDRQATHAHHQVAIGDELFVFRRQSLVSQEQEFSAVQADAVGAAGACHGHVGSCFGVGEQGDADAITGACGRIGKQGQATSLEHRFALPGAIPRQILRGGMHDRFAAFCVEQDQVVVMNIR